MAPTKTDPSMAHLELATHCRPREPFTFDTGTTTITETVTDPVTGEERVQQREEPSWEVLNPSDVFRTDHPYVLARPDKFTAVHSSRESVETMTAAPGEKRGARR